MGVSAKTTGDLVRIAAAGASLEIDTQKTTGDLVRIAAAIASGGGHLTIIGSSKTTGDMVRIAAAAPGKVTFRD
ncbi:hypothetical protein GIW50_12500 [Pseudomonas syringae]|uniref:Uncharacterized protein n=1 Tax=Pseudomonas syringae TaxID=317 RepID=A0A9Q3ZW24_PSESX|nr:hypothetical protein [Pseudomonas syringae]MCF5064945.1 hypothetical protein [Pseudomonas syringae]MCF5074910.1 hypothetical protein [Pseudomonas syringae]MCF5119223.1 hypothetical protein [Pseudomonas syringae]MCF5379061.1 hypothetical protein [Pseudomonas syringae]